MNEWWYLDVVQWVEMEENEVRNERVWCGVELRLKEVLGEPVGICPQALYAMTPTQIKK